MECRGKLRKTPVKAINLNTGETIIFPSQYEAAKKLGLHRSNIHRVITKQSSHSGDWYFEYYGKVVENNYKLYKTLIKAINLNTGETIIFPSQYEAAKKLGLHRSNIHAVISKRYKHTGGYYFELIDQIKE